MLKFQNFGWPPGQPRFPGPFSPAVGQNSNFSSQRFVCLVVPIPKRIDMTPLPQNPTEKIDLAETRFFWARAGPCGPRGLCHPPKNCLGGVQWVLKIPRRFVQLVKNYGTFSKLQTNGHTQTKTNHLSITTEFFFAYM